MDDITAEELETATISSGAHAILRLFREMREHEMETLSHNSHTQVGQVGLLRLQGHEFVVP